MAKLHWSETNKASLRISVRFETDRYIAKIKKKLPAVREEQKKAAQVRRRIKNILEQQLDEKEWTL